MSKEIKELHKELQKLKKEKDEIDNIYEEKKAELHKLINETVGDGHEIFVNIPDWVPLSPELIKNFALGKHPEATITNIDFEKRLVRLFIPAEYKRFTHEDEYGKIERRINRGKPFLDLDLLRIIDEDIWEKVTRAQIVLDEYELEKLIKSDENVLETVQNAIKTTKPKTALYFSNIKETDKT
jgi:hypothetical protein